jgi:deoxyribose-phosphate aldolase
LTRDEIARKMNTSLLGPAVSRADLTEFIGNCTKYPIAGIAVHASHIPLARRLLEGTESRVVGVVSYPLFNLTRETVADWTRATLALGAHELDVGIDVAAVRSGDLEEAYRSLRGAVETAEGAQVKAVLLCGAMSDDEKLRATEVAVRAGAQYVKTNTGYGMVTTVEDVLLINDRFAGDIKIMVAGGVRDTEKALAMYEAGAELVATSTPLKIIEGLPEGETR